MRELPPTLFLAWQDKASRRWFPIGRLRWLAPKARFEFSYTRGFELAHREAGLEPVIGFPDVHRFYEAPELFPQFRNRIMHSSREDFGAYLERLDLSNGKLPPMIQLQLEILARSEGRRSTDSFEVFPLPLKAVDEQLLYQADFFVHGMRYVPHGEERALGLIKNERLLLMADWQNPADRAAIAVRTADNQMLGWLPRYYCADVAYLREQSEPIEVVVERVNPGPAPVQQALLCRLTARWPTEHRLPFGQPEYQCIASEHPATADLPRQ